MPQGARMADAPQHGVPQDGPETKVECAVMARDLGIATIAVALLALIIPQAGLARDPGVPGGASTIAVTGDPTPVETMRAALIAAAPDLMPEAREGRVILRETIPSLQPLRAGAGTTIRAMFQTVSGGPLALTRVAPVEIRHQAALWRDAQRLLVSNSPEMVAFSTLLFTAALAPAEAVRLIYHHQNAASRPMTVTVALSNPTSQRVEVWVTGAAPSVQGDELMIGHAAARDFLSQYWCHAAFLLSIPAHTTSHVIVHTLAPGEIASGLLRVAAVGNAGVTLQVIARLDGDLDPPTEGALLPPGDRLHQRGTFEQPLIEHRLDYMVGGRFAMMVLGAPEDLLHERDSGDALQGNYGVDYTFFIRVRNPLPTPVTAVLEMHAAGGQAGGVFRVDDRIVDVPRVEGGRAARVAGVRIPGSGDRLVVVSTMPESGANYPVLLTLGYETW
jgi:hypothetical protein